MHQINPFGSSFAGLGVFGEGLRPYMPGEHVQNSPNPPVPPLGRRPKRWRIRCPRCRQPTCIVWPHEHNRFVCSGGTCPAFMSRCENPACEYPSPAGLRAWEAKRKKRGLDNVFWAYGRYADAEIKRIMERPCEPLPPPFNGRVP